MLISSLLRQGVLILNLLSAPTLITHYYILQYDTRERLQNKEDRTDTLYKRTDATELRELVSVVNS